MLTGFVWENCWNFFAFTSHVRDELAFLSRETSRCHNHSICRRIPTSPEKENHLSGMGKVLGYRRYGRTNTADRADVQPNARRRGDHAIGGGWSCPLGFRWVFPAQLLEKTCWEPSIPWSALSCTTGYALLKSVAIFTCSFCSTPLPGHKWSLGEQRSAIKACTVWLGTLMRKLALEVFVELHVTLFLYITTYVVDY